MRSLVRFMAVFLLLTCSVAAAAAMASRNRGTADRFRQELAELTRAGWVRRSGAMCRIEFHAPAAEFDRIPHPYPAGRHVPEWFKNMPAEFEKGGTVKRCPPYLTAMTAGYIIPAPADVRLTMNSQGKISAIGEVPFIGSHFQQQFAGSPFASSTVLKFINPWIIVTPPDHVCLITAPINRFEMPFMALSGIVETGAYYKEVHLPMVCLLGPGQSYDLRCGMPMIQVIPIAREDWTMGKGHIDMVQRSRQQVGFDANPHEYKERYWKRLEFSD